MRIFWIAFFIMLFLESLPAQEIPTEEWYLENFEIENLGESDFSQILSELAENPININRASIKDLLKIPFLTPTAARQIVRYRKQHGDFQGKNQLLKVPGINTELVGALLPFIRFQAPPRASKLSYLIQGQQILHRVKGIENGVYGNSLKFYQKIIYQHGRGLNMRIIWEKDAGEADWFDFGSISVNYQPNARPYAFSVGDYNIKVGQQLIFGRTYGTPITVNSPRLFSGESFDVLPKSSINEFSFLRGWVGEYQIRRLRATIGYSSRRLDATLDETTGNVTSFYTSGLHRSETERRKKNREREDIIFFSLKAGTSSWQTGILYAQTKYEWPISLEFGVVSGGNYVSQFYSWQRKGFSFQGEFALLNFTQAATQHSFYIQTGNFFAGGAAYYYHPRYWALHGKGLGEINTYPANKTGFLFNIGGKIAPTWQWSALWHVRRRLRKTDQFQNWQRRFQLQLKSYTSKQTFRLLYSQDLFPSPIPTSAKPYFRLHRLRTDFSTSLSSALRISHRIEAAYQRPAISNHRTYGFSFYLDIRYKIHRDIFTEIRWTQFDIPDFDLRIYEFENDLPGNFQNVLLNDRGYKWFLLMKFTQWNGLRLYIKYQEMYFPDKKEVGSGQDTILGNRKRSIRVQVRFRI